MASDSGFERLKVAVREAVAAGESVLVAVSGGPDSVALARAARDTLNGVTIAHINHDWRGIESDEDETFVRGLAKQLGLPLQTVRLERRPRSEADARKLRYDALERLRAECGSDSILLGHTLDDQAETVLLNLFRGTGARGLGGMAPRSGRLIRPFLSIERSIILCALEEIGQDFRLDRSNLDTVYRRNWIRAHIMPAVQDRIPSAAPSIARAADLLRSDADYLAGEAAEVANLMVVEQGEGFVQASLGAWRNLHPSLQRRTLRQLVGTVLDDSLDLTEDHVERLKRYVLEPGPNPLNQLPRGLHARVDGKTFRLWVGEDKPVEELPEATLPVPGRLTVLGGEIVAEVWPEPDENQKHAIVVAGPLHALLDGAAIESPLTVRPRRPGDRMRPAHGSGSRSAQDLFVDRRIPRATRATIPLVLSAGRIIWIPGVAVDERFTATDASGPIVHLVMAPKTGT